MLILKTILTMTEGKMMVSNKLLFIVVVLCCLFACNEKKPSSYKVHSNQNFIRTDTMTSVSVVKGRNIRFIPDTSICNIALDSHISIEREFGDIMGDSINEKNGYEVFYFSNIDTSEYLTLVFFPGNTKNAFSRFVISKFETRPINRRLSYTRCSVFSTESQIKLGISITELEEIKGRGYLKTQKSNFEIYTYSVTSDINSPFYRRYKLPIYSAIYRFKNNKLVEFEFGFENP